MDTVDFFDRNELISEVSNRLENSKFVVVAIKDKERDDYNSVSKRLLFEADEHQFHREEQLWPLDFLALSSEASLEEALVKAAEDHFFPRGFPGDKTTLNWHGIVEQFAQQNFLRDKNRSASEARLVIELDFPEASIKRHALENLLVLIKAFIKLRKHLSDNRFKCTVFVVVYMPGRAPLHRFLSKLSLSSLNRINFNTLCKYLDGQSGSAPFQFVANTLTELEAKHIQELGEEVANKLRLPNTELLKELSRVAKDHLRQNGKASYSSLINYIVTHDVYDALTDVTDLKPLQPKLNGVNQ